MAPAVLDAPISSTQKPSAAEETRPSEAASTTAAQTAGPQPTDAILSLDQVAVLLGKTQKHARNLTGVGLLKHQLIDGERCVWLSDLITYKRDFDRDYAEYLKSPTSRMDDSMLNPFDVLPEYAAMLEP